MSAMDINATPKQYLPSVATMSLGNAKLHALDKKIKAAATMGFQGIELYWPDLVEYARKYETRPNPHSTNTTTHGLTDMATISVLMAAAKHVGQLCRDLNIEVVSLQPFRNFDGVTNPILRAKRIAEFGLWMNVANELRAGVIGVPSTLPVISADEDRTDDDYTGDKDAIARDLKELAELAAPRGIRIAYENLCFGRHIQHWEDAWDIINLASREDDSSLNSFELGASSNGGLMKNLVFLPDTFNICGSKYMDPTTAAGRARNATLAFNQSLKDLTSSIPVAMMPLLQVADAELPASPLDEHHPWRAAVKGSGTSSTGCEYAKLSPLMALSRNARLFPLEEDGYLPVVSVVRAFVQAGWSGWVSMEVFSRTTEKEGDETIWQHAKRAWESWLALADAMGWEKRPTK